MIPTKSDFEEDDKLKIRPLSESEIQDRTRDLEEVLSLYSSARDKLSSAVILIREASNIYQEFMKKCSRSESNRYAMVVQRLRGKFMLDMSISTVGKLLTVVNSSLRTQTLNANDLKESVLDPELLPASTIRKTPRKRLQ